MQEFSTQFVQGKMKTAGVFNRHAMLMVSLICVGIFLGSVVAFGQQSEANASQLLSVANQAFEKHDWKVAADGYSRLAALYPKNPEIFARMGIVYQNLEKLDKAEASFKRALQIDPNMSDIGVLLAFVYIRLGQYKAAVGPLERALDDNHSDQAVRLAGGERLVDVYFLLGEQQKGLEVVQKLRRLAPDNPDVLYTAAKVYSSMWKGVVNRLVAKDASSYRTHQVLAEAAIAKGNLSEAAKEYRLIIKMKPHLPGFHYELGMLILKQDPSQKGMQEALDQFQKELEVNPQDVPTNTEMGEIYSKMHQLSEAERCFYRAIKTQPSYAHARIDLGRTLIAEKEFPAATKQLEEAARLAPDNPAPYYQLMIAYRALGQTADAETALKTFQRLRTEKAQQHASTLKELQAPVLSEPRSNSHPQ